MSAPKATLIIQHHKRTTVNHKVIPIKSGNPYQGQPAYPMQGSPQMPYPPGQGPVYQPVPQMPTYSPPGYNNPQPMMMPHQPHTHTVNTVVVSAPAPSPHHGNIVMANAIQVWPNHSVFIKCLACQKSGYTRVTRSLRPIALLFVIFLFFVICLFSFIIFCLDASYCTEHHCIHCDTHLGTSA